MPPNLHCCRFGSLLFRYGVYVSLAVLLIVALIRYAETYEGQQLYLNLRGASQLGLVAIGQTLVLLTAGLDLQ